MAGKVKRFFKRAGLTAAVLLVLAASFVAHEWYAKPFFINNFFNRAFIQFVWDRPEFLTSMGVLEQLGIAQLGLDLLGAGGEAALILDGGLPLGVLGQVPEGRRLSDRLRVLGDLHLEEDAELLLATLEPRAIRDACQAAEPTWVAEHDSTASGGTPLAMDVIAARRALARLNGEQLPAHPQLDHENGPLFREHRELFSMTAKLSDGCAGEQPP